MYRGQGISMDHGSANANANASALEFLCGVTTMMGTLEEVSEYFDQCTTPRMRMRKADDVVDCAVLYSLVSSNTVNPFHRVAIKYAQYDSPVAMTRKRDFCYLECQDTFRHSGTGRRGWVLSMHSIKLPTCPDVPGFVRASMYHSGFVFIESAERPGYMDVMHSLQINFKGNNHLPHFMLNAALKRRLRELIRISREIQVARIAHRTLLQEKDLMPKNLRSSCVNCSRRFWLLVRKTRCRVCGEVVCQACAPEIDWDTGSAIYPAGAAPAGPSSSTMKTRVCLKCYSSAPTTGSWTARNSTAPWTEQSRMAAAYDHQQAGRQRPFPRPTMQQVDEGAEDSDDDDGGEGRFTFAELEVQSSQSVFAPERFTRSSIASLATTPLQVDQFGADFDDDVYTDQSKNRSRNVNRGLTSGLQRKDDDTASVQSTEYRWQARATDDSLFDHTGSFSSSIMSRDSYFGRNDDSATFAASRRLTAVAPQLDENEVVMEEPDENQISHVNLRASRRVRNSSPKNSATNTSSTKGFEFLDGLIDIPVNRLAGKQQTTTARPRAQTAINVSSARSAIVHRSLESELNATTLRAHNLRYLNSLERDAPTSSRANYDKPTEQHSAVSEAISQVGNNASASVGTRESSAPATQPVEEAVSLDDIVPSDSIDYGRVGSISSVATDELLAETSNNSLFSRPSSLILQQVRKNRSRTILFHPSAIDETPPRDTETFKTVEDEHRRRMDELNQLALEYTGTRISKLDTRPSLAPEPELSEEEEIWRKSSLLEEYQSRRKKTIELLRQRVASVQEDGQARASNPEFRPSDSNTRVSQASSGRESLFKLTAAESPVPQAPLTVSNEQSELDEEPWRSTELMEAYRSKRKNTIEAIRQKMMSIQNEERDSSGTDHTAVSSRSSSFIGTKMVGAPSEHHPNGLPEDLTFIPSLSTSGSTLGP
ncbi:hypothetical protein PINS_up004620 [Pythium insidiosum]|nr:hypothetical protein PINS_up004620 [Pythium insidiosum]